MKEFYARLKPFVGRKGSPFKTVNFTFRGQLFQGGDRPTWYKVSEEYARQLRLVTQDEGVAPMFDVADDAEKAAIDQKEEQLRLVALGHISATHAAPSPPTAIDLTTPHSAPLKPPTGLEKAPAASPAAREAAIPTTAGIDEDLDPRGSDASVRSGGDLTTRDLPRQPVASR